jgi:prepilin-type N-terminal cleavage/methylation domain-containing protein
MIVMKNRVITRTTQSGRSHVMVLSGFTLIELLVVIAIIAVLAALLLPALAAARLKAQGIRCLSNEKQMAVSAILYQDEHHGTIPWGATGNASQLWMTALLQYVSDPDVRVCPVAANPTKPATANNTQGTAVNAWHWGVLKDPNNVNSTVIYTNASYGFNGWLYQYQTAIAGFAVNQKNYFNTFSAVTHPSGTPIFVDALWPDLWPYQGDPPVADASDTWYPFDDNNNANGSGSAGSGMVRCLIQRHGAHPLTGPKGFSVTDTDEATGLMIPLAGGVNVVLQDGHAEYSTLDHLWLYYWNKRSVPVPRS